MNEAKKDGAKSSELLEDQRLPRHPGKRMRTPADMVQLTPAARREVIANRARALGIEIGEQTMSDETRSQANQMYAEAHQEQYKNNDLPAALAIYREIIAVHPEQKEAGYSRGQIRNIASKVVPKQELLDAELELALSHLV